MFPPKRSNRALVASLVTLLTMGLVVLSGVAADAAPHGTPVFAAVAVSRQAEPGRTLAPQPRRDPANLQAVAAALDVDDLTEPRSRTTPPVPEPIVAASRPSRAASHLPSPDRLTPERPPRA